jgi:indole-3-glycerol phosphate synthase
MADASRDRVTAAKSARPEYVMRTAALESPTPRLPVIRRGEFNIIAEVKRRSPSAGQLTAGRPDGRAAVADRVRKYAQGGAAVISVLTEPSEFCGALSDISVAAQACDTPVMRKDFLVDAYQVFEARAEGASGVLLIVRIVDQACLRKMIEAAANHGLFILLEAFDESDLAMVRDAVAVARDHSATIYVGVNARDLVTLEVDRGRLAALATLLPDDAVRIAESGTNSPDDARYAASLGYDGLLVGSALMRTSDPEQLVHALLKAGREEALRP